MTHLDKLFVTITLDEIFSVIILYFVRTVFFFTTLESPMISNHFNCNFSRSLYFKTIGLYMYILWYCKPCNMTHAIKIKIRYFSKSRYFTIYVEPSYSNLFSYHFSSSLFYFIILKLQPFEFTSKIEFVLIKNKGDHYTFNY